MKPTRKGQATVPDEARERLSAAPGDVVADEKAGVRRRNEPLDGGYLRAVQVTLAELESADDAVYDAL